MGVSKNRGTPKSSILIGFSIINHPFWGTPIFGNIHIQLIKSWKFTPPAGESATRVFNHVTLAEHSVFLSSLHQGSLTNPRIYGVFFGRNQIPIQVEESIG